MSEMYNAKNTATKEHQGPLCAVCSVPVTTNTAVFLAKSHEELEQGIVLCLDCTRDLAFALPDAESAIATSEAWLIKQDWQPENGTSY
jgi:hypothetical protein